VTTRFGSDCACDGIVVNDTQTRHLLSISVGEWDYCRRLDHFEAGRGLYYIVVFRWKDSRIVVVTDAETQ
jgi:hypothetical protein